MTDGAEHAGGTSGLRVVVVDSRTERRHLFRNLVESTGLVGPDIAEAVGATEAVEFFEAEDCDVAFVEIQPVAEGLETIAVLRQVSSGLRIVVCSFHRDAATKEQALARGADVYLDKPVSSYALTNVLLGFFPDASTTPEASPEDPSQPVEPQVPLALGPVRRRS
ncbi:MAG: response regulator [Acidimicrobiia bacterium]